MEHIRQFDWCSSQSDTSYFLTEKDIDNSVTERILRNKFHDPLLSSDSEGEQQTKPKINWDEIFNRRENGDKLQRMFVPGLRAPPPYPKLSSMTEQQHYSCLKVLCAQNRNVLPAEFLPRPTKKDLRIFEEVSSQYMKEQEEYIEWAKTLWTNGQCIRALRPKPTVETVYEAEFKVKANELKSFPKTYELAAQIPLETNNNSFEMVFQKELINVDVTRLPQIEYPEMIVKRMTVMRPCDVPEPCNKHPCRFILPTENAMSILPVTEVHRELAQYALDNNAQYIASENALKCLVEQDRWWSLPLSVCKVMGADGDTSNVVVLGSEFTIHRQSARTRTYRAFRHLLEYTLIPLSEKRKLLTRGGNLPDDKHEDNDVGETANDHITSMETTSDDEEDNLFIDAEDDTQPNCMDVESELSDVPKTTEDEPKETEVNKEDTDRNNSVGFYSCTCKDTIFERPPPRSFKKWQFRNNKTNEHYDVIVHCAHKVRGKVGEVLLEPIPEYQIDLGGSRQSADKIKSLALSLHLRRNASLLNVRVDGPTGDIVTCESMYPEEIVREHGELVPGAANTAHTVLNQIQGLLPGHYVLQHEPSHGSNALLYVARNSDSPERLALEFDSSQLAEADEAKSLKTPPTLCPALLPYHKLRKILPCAFTTKEFLLAKEPKKPVTRQRTPPQAIKWPKRKRKNKKNQ